MKNKKLRIVLMIFIAVIAVLVCVAVILCGKKEADNKAEDPSEESHTETTTKEPDIPEPLELIKDTIPRTADWQTSGLESAGITGVEMGDPYKASFGNLYVLKHYHVSGVYHDTFFAIETEKTVYLQKISELTAIEDILICDINGKIFKIKLNIR